MVIPRRVRLAMLVWGILLAAGAVAGAASAPAVNAVMPIALRQGQTIELSMAGQGLGGITSAPVADAQGVSVEVVKPGKPNPNEVRLKITAGADAAPGDRAMRLLGPEGVTRPIHVFVSQYPVIHEKEPNNSPEESQAIELPAALLGRIDAPGDVDQFHFHAARGQKLIFDAHAARNGSPLELVATIHSADGREMRTSLERRGGDPVLIFDVPEEGDYRLRLRDLQYRGGGDYEYRILAGAIPYLETLLPSSGEPGATIAARAIGYNLGGADKITIDLTHSAPGRIEVRAKTPAGSSNAMPFEVTELPQIVESESNNDIRTASAMTLPAEVSAHVDRPGDEDFFKFHLAYKQVVNLEVLAGRYGSPVTPLLQLRDSQGKVIESNDGTPEADARIVRELEAGDYCASVRDLSYAGGEGYWYRLKAEPAMRVPQDFAVRFLPDAPRLHRGGNVPVWCEVKRLNGFKGDVTITPEGLPSGVAPTGPIVLSPGASGWFTLAAAPDAALGAVPLRLRATAMVGNVPVTRYGEPELDGRAAADAYLTVIEPSPFKVEAVATFGPQRIQQMNAEIGQLAAKLNVPGPKFESSLAAWAKKAADRPAWTVLNPATASSAKGTPLTRQPDGSFIASGNMPPKDVFTVTANTDLKGITAIRLEVIADPRLPGHGPGAASNGNFVLSAFKLLAGKAGGPSQPVAIKSASADFSQANFPVTNAIQPKPDSGWAVMPELGKTHTATFVLGAPIRPDDITTLTFVMEHMTGFASHLIGRFRLSVTTADPALLAKDSELPPDIAGIVDTPRDELSAEQQSDLAAYFRTIDPDTAPERMRLEGMRSYVEPYAEMQRLEAALKAETPKLQKEQQAWEKQMAAGEGWGLLPVALARSGAGVRLERQPDGSYFANGLPVANDTYELTVRSPLKGITAIRLELLPDSRLPNSGPGRAPDGNFILTRFQAIEEAKPGGQAQAIQFGSARATFEQEKYELAGALDNKDDTGWAISPAMGRPVEATFYPKRPIPGGMLTIRLEQRHKLAGFTIGRFRLWATTNKQPDAAARPPERIGEILRSAGRSPVQQAELAAYFRSIAPSLAPVRQRLADLRPEVPSIPIRVPKAMGGVIPVPIDRAAGFTGDVNVSLEGFVNGRDGNGPAPIGKEFVLAPLTIPGDKMFGTLTFLPVKREQPGTRMVVLKAEAKVGNETITEYSPAFPLTVEK
jgi:hypothetical protein